MARARSPTSRSGEGLRPREDARGARQGRAWRTTRRRRSTCSRRPGAEVDREALTAQASPGTSSSRASRPCPERCCSPVATARGRSRAGRVAAAHHDRRHPDLRATTISPGERREGTTADLATFVRLCDALSEVDTIWPSPQASDIDPYMLPLVTQADDQRCATRASTSRTRSASRELVEPILAMYEAAVGASLTERPYFSVTNCTIAPLQHDRDMTEAALKMVKRGVPIFVLPMPQAGHHGAHDAGRHLHPQHGRAALGAWCSSSSRAPGCALISGVGSAVADMRTGGYIAAPARRSGSST